MDRKMWRGKPNTRMRLPRWNTLFVVICWLLLYFTSLVPSVKANLSFTILEEQPSGTIVGKIQDCVSRSCSFDGNVAFTIDSGVIKSTATIDRDILTANPIQLNVRSSDPNFQSKKVQILVHDINDNYPKFPSLFSKIQIAETTTVGVVYPINTATDSDFGYNGTVDYSIDKGNIDGEFTLGIGSNKCQGKAELCIIINKTLDRETTDSYELKISASDRGMPPLTGYCFVNITILDANDNHPLFTSDIYKGSIAENTKSGKSILYVNATDKDSGSNSQIEYSIEKDAEKSDEIFDIKSNTGLISTKGSLDYEIKNSYKFTVVASDKGQPKESSTSTVVISITDKNDNAPKFVTFFYYPNTNLAKAVVSEDCNLMTILAFLKVSDSDGSMPNNDINLEISKGNENGFFLVQEHIALPGAYFLRVAKALDREVLGNFNLTLNATDHGIPSKSTITFAIVEVLDVNDNPPKFYNNLYIASINELAPNGSYVLKINATDPDAGNNGTVSYSITGGNGLGWFQIDSLSGLVTTVTKLDRELVSSVSITITAQDHGSIPKIASTTLKITIRDENDNPPKFSTSFYNASIPEDSTKDRIIVKLSASDKDTSNNAKISFAIDSMSQDLFNHFILDPSSGVLRLKKSVDREVKSSFNIPVIATDNGMPKLSSKAVVSVTVTDINDNNPIFYPEVYFVSVLENKKPGPLVMVTATDKDDNLNGKVFYSIKSGNFNNSFDININTGEIRTLKSLDHETKGFHKLEISARDGGGNVASKSAFVEITVINQADNPPYFDHDIYNFSVYENAPKRTLVGKVFAKTKDKNDTILYEIISGDPGHLFIVDSSGGIIMVNGVIDRELKANFWLEIVAKTGQARPLSAKTSVNITVLDRNDNVPKFTKSYLQVEILGSWLPGRLISDVSAEDSDAGSNGMILYQLTNNANGLFKINITSGVVTLARKPTESDSSQYTVQVMASDFGSPQLHGTITIQADILINHPPKFRLTPYVVHVSASWHLTHRFLFVSAIDRDSGNNGEVSYSIDQLGNQEDLFGIFPDGMLYIKKNLIYASKGLYDIVVRATDNGTPRLSASVKVTIYIQDTDQHRALFANNTFSFEIAENLPPGSSVGAVTAHAPDSSKTKDIIYSLVSSNNLFAIDAKSGRITTRLSLDREVLIKERNDNNYIMRAEAVYNDTTVRHDSAIVIVTVSDMNDNPPLFSSGLYNVKVNEKLVPVSVVYRVTAIDPDSGQNANFTYSILKGTGKDIFHIDKKSGDLYLDKPLNRETADSYNLTLQATDILNSSLYSKSVIQITVEDYNDEKPLFQSFSRSISVLESLSIGSEVIDLNATDKDIGPNGQIMYSIACGNLEAVFDINHSTGRVFVSKHLDYERTKQYHLCFMAQDRGNPSLSSSRNLTINVIDVNDNAPMFSSLPQKLRILENVTMGTVVGACSATDKDSGSYGQIAYSLEKLIPKGEIFSVDSKTCTITTMASIDREQMPRNYYQLVVKATDKTIPASRAMSAIKEIIIVVDDVNDNKPRFVSPPAAKVGTSTFVMNVKAVDFDEGTNGLVTYNMITNGPSKNLFHLNADSGQLDKIGQLTDNKLFYKRLIKAQDQGRPALEDQTEITLFKTGSSGPMFTNSTFYGAITENKGAGFNILRVKAYYTNSQSNSNIKYYLTFDDSKGALSVNEVTGDLVTKLQIDRESLGSVLKLVVYAVDMQGPNPRTSSTNVVITVKDVNDNAPEFSANHFTVSINEDIPTGSLVITLAAKDIDEGINSNITYSITGGSHGDMFMIDSQTGKVTSLKYFNREAKAVYTMNVTARDHGNPSHSSSCLVTVRIEDINDNAPSFTKSYYSFKISEDALIGTTVGIVRAIDKDTGENARLTYSILGADKEIFDLNPSTGALTLSQRLDRETVEHYILNVSAKDNGQPYYSTSVHVYVTVLDINDNSPEFNQKRYHGDIMEGESAFTHVITVSAFDRDAASNGLINYSIISGNSGNSFGILKNGTIVNLKVLDREVQDGYRLTVQASDEATPLTSQRYTTARVFINVTDINDNKPYFTSSSLAYVSESAKVGNVVLTVIAVDLDQGSNSQLLYTLTKIDIPVPFSLGKTDGVLRVSGVLDRETKENYTLEVTAADAGNPQLSSDMRIIIVIVDSNDHAPTFLKHPSNVSIYENITIGTTIIVLSAVDQDVGVNAEVRYEIVIGNSKGAFTINSITGRLRTVKTLDRETSSQHVLEIRAYDLGAPRRQSVTTFTVLLRDVNDEKPNFTKETYMIDVEEDVIDASIVTVIAQDSDEGNNGDITYSIIHGDTNGVFVVNSRTGIIRLTAKLDREQNDTYKLTVQAKDGGIPSMIGKCQVIINVLDKNDNKPIFQPDNLLAKVPEQAAVGTFVIQVTASDKDTGSNADLTYSLVNDFARFRIDSKTGRIETAKELDKEQIAYHPLEVIATDGGNPPLQGKATINVKVEDTNDHDPVFENSLIKATVQKNAVIDTIVTVVAASDKDTGDNAKSDYTIVSGNIGNIFKLSKESGVMYVAKTVPATPLTYTLQIKATNHNSPKRAATATVKLYVSTGLFPKFLHPDKTLSIPESTLRGKTLITVNATGHTAYFIAGGDDQDQFDVDAVYGTFKVQKSLDYEKSNNYSIVIGAKDGSTPPRVGFTTIHVFVQDENDNAPVFSQLVYHANIKEGLPANSSVVNVTAEDADSAPNARIQYSISLPNGSSSPFEISSSGEVFTKRILDREKTSWYSLKVTAQNVGKVSISSEAVVIVTVDGVNDNPPVFVGGFSDAHVTENAPAGAVVTVLKAEDSDSITDPSLQYSIQASTNKYGLFVIDPIKGTISTTKALDREQRASYTLMVSVNDSKHQTTSSLNITVLDVNDNAPKFPTRPYATQIPESSPIDHVVMNVSAIDVDVGVNAFIVYSIASKQPVSHFSIDAKLGIISINKALEFHRGKSNTYNLTIKAQNVYVPYLKGYTHVEIRVLDTNDHAPVFKQAKYRFVATVDSSNGAHIGSVHAEDTHDYGPNAEIRYEVLSGNGSTKFRVIPENGEVGVKADLTGDANKVYCINIKAKDLGNPSKEAVTRVCIDVTPKNFYDPKFSLPVYRKAASEDLPVGSVIVTVVASDDDSGKNGELSYSIASGNSQGYFGIGVTNGSIYVAKHLDYELSPKYVLNVVATDGGMPSRSSSVPAEITLLDVNDNNPLFKPSSYFCKLQENATPGSKVICTVHATDKDKLGKQDVRYYIASGVDAGKFSIDSLTGGIKATAKFDFEKTEKTTLSVGAKDLGLQPQRFADPRADVFIAITGENEFVPVFTSDEFRGTVAENAPLGHSVLKVSATDKDSGVDGIVVYHLVGADNHKGFSLNTETGILSISRNLDSEKQGNVTLKVIAKNLFQAVVTPGTVGHATITVTVTDANDAPRFLQSVYMASVTEGVSTKSYVTNVTAVDDDRDRFSSEVHIRYGISTGNTNLAFVINQLTGVITTDGVLDRESIPVYELTVTATDNGFPPMTGNATVKVTLRDVNDNAPTLIADDQVTSILENQPTGTSVITLRATDRDVDPHRGPFTFQISGANYGKFVLNRNTGLLKTTAILDRENKASYNLSIRVTDSGGLYAISYCLVTVKDMNDNRPKASPRVVMVNTYDKRFPGGSVADVRPEDADVDDAMTCHLITSSCHMFSFPRGDCMLYSLAKFGDSLCVLKINGSDGIGSVRYNVTVSFSGYTSDTVRQSVALRLQKTTPKDFLTNYYSSFSQAVLRILPAEFSSFQIISIKRHEQGFIDVLVSARKPNTFTYLRKEKLSELLKVKERQVEMEGKVDIYRVDYTPCVNSSPCKNGAECSSEIVATGNTFIINTVPLVFVSAHFIWKYSCRCKPGFTGSKCEININDCNPNPCSNGGTCADDGSSFTCSCPEGFSGIQCQTEIDGCASNPCKYATTCQNSQGSYICHCQPGYSGKNCESKIDFCQGSPCMYNSTCVAQPSSFKCECDFGGRGERCQITSFGFSYASFMKFKTLLSNNQESYNNITLSFATHLPGGLLFYNNDGTVKEDGDFIALEVVQGKVRFSYNLGYTKNAAAVIVDRFVNDSQWHHVTVIRDKVTAQVVVDYKFKSTGSVAGQFTQLELNSSPLYVGGVQDFDQAFNDQRKHIGVYDFVGCIRDFFINGDELSYKDAIGSVGAFDHCPYSNFCAPNPCRNNGKCKDSWFSYYCECADGYSGNNCEKTEPSAVRFSSSTSLVLQFKESYRRQQKQLERQDKSTRRRRSISSKGESFDISFRTLKGGLVLIARDDTQGYTMVLVTSNRVHYEFKSTSFKNNITIHGSFIDGKWHNVSLQRTGKTITLRVDSIDKQQTFTQDTHKFLGATVRTWALGGTTQPPQGVKVSNFNGCMERLKINGINVPLTGANGYVNAKSQGGTVAEGCGVKNGACQSNPCIADLEKPACLEDWYGYSCVSNEPCTPNPCYNNGTCTPGKDGSFTCMCHANYSGEVCELCRSVPCVTAGKRQQDSPFSIGIIAGLLFLVFVLVGIIVGILAVKRHQKLKRESDYDAKHCDDICIPGNDIQDGSHRASPSHSSDDSGVVIRNPSQKSNPDLRISPNENSKDIVIHKMGAPQDYQLKLHKSDERIDHGFSESDVGEFVIKNDYSVRSGSHEQLNHLIYPRRDVQQTSTPKERNWIRSAPRQRPRTRDRRPPNSLARQVLEKRHYGPPKIDHRIRPPHGGRYHKRRSHSIDTTSSDEQHDFSDGGPRSEMDTSEMLDYYDIDVASIGVSEASYQYEPSMFKDSMARRDLPAFSQSEIDRIRQQSSRNPPSGSFLDAISSSSDDDPIVHDKLSSLMEKDDTSSESSDDTFTCSEFEFDERPTARAEEIDSHGSMIFSRLTKGEPQPRCQPGSRTVSQNTVMSENDLVIANRLVHKSPVNGVSEDFDWDDVLNWGLRYNHLRGVYKDIAELKDGVPDDGEQYV